MLKGDLAQFAPADLLLFLCHMNKEGVLTVRAGGEVLSLGFRRNLLVEAHGEAADRVALGCLARDGAADPDAVARLHQAQDETGLPLARILADVASLPPPAAAAALAAGRQEAVLRLLLLERGEFHFTELPVDELPLLEPCDGPALVLDLTRQVDEYREVVRGLGSLERRPVRTAAGTTHLAAGGGVATLAPEVLVLEAAGAAPTAAALLDGLPLPRPAAAAAVRDALAAGWLELATASVAAPAASAVPADTAFFAQYRRALRQLLQADDPQRRIRELLQFAQARCKTTVLLVVQTGRLRRATVYYRDPGGRLAARDHRDPSIELSADPIFQHVLQSGRPFLGEAFPSLLLDALEADAPAADCAILPLGTMGGHDLLLYAATAERSPALGPLSCLELLSWQVRRPTPETRTTGTAPAAAPTRAAGAGADPRRMVAAIKDLPPMPQTIVRVLEMLGDPDCKLSELTAALAQDPALVARLIKVSNSSLYGAGQACNSLNQAVVRLGTRTTRSVVVAASTRALFPADSSRVGQAGRRLWRHAIATGLAARRVAEFTRRADPDEAFAGGVLHDLGKLIILLNLPDAAGSIERELRDGSANGDGAAAERRALGFDHAEVGELLLQGWRLPAGLVACARWHHQPAAAGDWTDLVRVVACGNLLSHVLEAGEDAEAAGRAARRLADEAGPLNLDEAACGDLRDLLALDLAQGDPLE